MKKAILLPLLFLVIHSQYAWSAKGDIVMYLGNETVLYEHVGIDNGEGYVIEFSRINDEAPAILKTPLEEFKKNSPTGKITYIDQQEFKRRFPDKVGKVQDNDTVVRIAESYVGPHGKFIGSYDAMENNCQHFAMLCKIGESYSWQAVKIKAAIDVLESDEVLWYPMQLLRYAYDMSLGYINGDWYKVISNLAAFGETCGALEYLEKVVTCAYSASGLSISYYSQP